MMIVPDLTHEESEKLVTVNQFIESGKTIPDKVTHLIIDGEEEKATTQEVQAELDDLREELKDEPIWFIPGIFPRGITVAIGDSRKIDHLLGL